MRLPTDKKEVCHSIKAAPLPLEGSCHVVTEGRQHNNLSFKNCATPLEGSRHAVTEGRECYTHGLKRPGLRQGKNSFSYIS